MAASSSNESLCKGQTMAINTTMRTAQVTGNKAIMYPSKEDCLPNNSVPSTLAQSLVSNVLLATSDLSVYPAVLAITRQAGTQLIARSVQISLRQAHIHMNTAALPFVLIDVPLSMGC